MSVKFHPVQVGTAAARGFRRHGGSVQSTTVPVLHPICMQVDFEGSYAIEGAEEVSTVMTRHVSRLLRPWLAGQTQGDTLQVSDEFQDLVLLQRCLRTARLHGLGPWHLPAESMDCHVQERRRQATDRFKHYFEKAMISGSKAVGSVLQGSGLQENQMEDQAAADSPPEYDTALTLRAARDQRALTLEKT